eukprot:gnl/MRDRNA2_/MRDRNA2_128959_c0_seq1.p1 gnl/MRDRNA2_/MRDRNA2_128959_c0~~gnl/MRDRNA2_/MRDRNA2_128959_c0_seq1.p1  ORF type:complete len:670 (+),score=86.01 gnl/MRDRNA2_/MRDRNA2_128959_c0_seq1:91-2100(+)
MPLVPVLEFLEPDENYTHNHCGPSSASRASSRRSLSTEEALSFMGVAHPNADYRPRKVFNQQRRSQRLQKNKFRSTWAFGPCWCSGKKPLKDDRFGHSAEKKLGSSASCTGRQWRNLPPLRSTVLSKSALGGVWQSDDVEMAMCSDGDDDDRKQWAQHSKHSNEWHVGAGGAGRLAYHERLLGGAGGSPSRERVENDAFLRGRDLAPDSGVSSNSSAYSAAWKLVCASSICEGMYEGTVLPVLYHFKEDFYLQPAEISLVISLTLAPWILKPVLAFTSDSLPIAGRRRSPYLIAASLLTAGAYACVGITTTFSGTVTCLMMTSLGRSITAAVTEAMLVELVRPTDKSLAGKSISESLMLRSSAALCSSYLSGVMLQTVPAKMVLMSCSALPVLVVLPFTVNLCLKESPQVASSEGLEAEELTQSAIQKLQMLRDTMLVPVMTAPLLLFFSYISGPSYDDALYYFYINKLALDPEYMGRVQLVHHFARVIGISSYRLYFHSIPARIFIVGITLISVPLYMTPLLLTTGYYETLGIEPKFLALSGELFRELCLHLQMLPLLSLWARRSPRGLEGSSFSLLTSIGTTGKVISRLSSSAAAQIMGVTADNFDNLSELICMCAASLLPPLYFVRDWPGDVEEEDAKSTNQHLVKMTPVEDEHGADTDAEQRILP